jgi:DNA-binding SARP family transcriptional activator
MEFRLLGPLEVIHRGRPVSLKGAKQRTLLAAFLLNADRTVTVGQLAQAIWPRPPRSFQSNLRTYVSALRAAFVAAGEPAGRVITEAAGYRFCLAPGELDLARFTQLFDEGEQALRRGESGIALDRFERAQGLWRGEPLAGLSSVGPLIEAEMMRLEELRLLMAERWADAALADGRCERVAAELTRLVKAQPFREHLWAKLMVALARSGRPEAALATYQRVYRLYDTELGIRPGRPLQLLHQQVLDADPGLLVPHPAR